VRALSIPVMPACVLGSSRAQPARSAPLDTTGDQRAHDEAGTRGAPTESTGGPRRCRISGAVMVMICPRYDGSVITS